MMRSLRIAAVQSAAVDSPEPFEAFAADVRRVLAGGAADCVVYPELHLVGTSGTEEEQNAQLHERAIDLDGPLVARLGGLARELGVWLVPGSIAERAPDGMLYNTALVFSPEGELVATYRKIFPWRPYEIFEPGDRFTVLDLPGIGRVGLSICYDAWFPEVSRHLAWLGAEVVLNVVKTTSSDRPQEVVLARANSIVNQTFTVSVNTAGPEGKGFSLVVDPEGHVLAETTDAEEGVLRVELDLDEVTRVREQGTMGTNRMWAQYTERDKPLELPLYEGRIRPERWSIQQDSAPLPGSPSA
ncbi:MAG: carbon-nitrogen hydrolase family protein [Naasia sp.]|nr:carbon-nitrogen hydrolase family protein [Naasia sp.]